MNGQPTIARINSACRCVAASVRAWRPRTRHTLAAAAAALIIWLQACSAPYTPPPPPTLPGQPKPYRVYGVWYQPLPHARDFVQEGVASWYGEDFHGRRTSSGEVYNMYDMTAAHKTLPLGTYVRVQNPRNGRNVEVRVNDRGPFVRDRIIDLSYTAARQLDIVGAGTAFVRVEALGAAPGQAAPGTAQTAGGYVPVDYYSGNFTFQVGAFTELANAERLVNKLNQQYDNAHLVTYQNGNRTFYRVRVGARKTLEEAAAFEQTLIQGGFPETFIVAE